MSKIALTPDASGTGTFTIAAPNSNTNRTLTLPDEAGTVLTNASNIEAQVKTATNATGDAPIYACRAWVNFNGTGTVAIRASGNVSSITDHGVGDYTVNLTTAMPDENFAVSGSAGSVASTSWDRIMSPYSISSSTVRVRITNSQANLLDENYVAVAIFR
jgi:hypothetical protein